MSWEPKPGDVVAVKAVMYNVPGLFSSAPPTVRISPGLYWPGMDGQDDNDFAQPVAPEDICAWIPPDQFAAWRSWAEPWTSFKTGSRKCRWSLSTIFPQAKRYLFLTH